MKATKILPWNLLADPVLIAQCPAQNLYLAIKVSNETKQNVNTRKSGFKFNLERMCYYHLTTKSFVYPFCDL